MNLLLLTLACIDGRPPVDVPLVFEGHALATDVVPDATLELDLATITVSNLRMLGPVDPLESWMPTLSLVPTAFAHPGHEFAGAVRAELLGRHELDALGTSEPLGDAFGYAGEVVSSRIELFEAHLVGRLITDHQTLPFDVVLPLERSLSGIPLANTLAVGESNTFALVFDLEAALSFADWTDEDGDGRLSSADSRFFNTLVFGVSSLDAWSMEKR